VFVFKCCNVQPPHLKKYGQEGFFLFFDFFINFIIFPLINLLFSEIFSISTISSGIVLGIKTFLSSKKPYPYC